MSLVVSAYAAEFARARRLCDGAVDQLPFELLRERLDPQLNTIAVLMKHVAGNLRSRWTDPFTSDGEKPWRDRDREFVDDFPDRSTLHAWWSAGWTAVEGVLASATDADLPRILVIRTEPHTLALALARSLAHTSYHTGQIVHLARALAARHGLAWRTLTIPPGGSAAHNTRLGLPPT